MPDSRMLHVSFITVLVTDCEEGCCRVQKGDVAHFTESPCVQIVNVSSLHASKANFGG